MVICNLCTKLGLRFGKCKSDAKAALVKEGVTTPNKEQLKEAQEDSSD